MGEGTKSFNNKSIIKQILLLKSKILVFPSPICFSCYIIIWRET